VGAEEAYKGTLNAVAVSLVTSKINLSTSKSSGISMTKKITGKDCRNRI